MKAVSVLIIFACQVYAFVPSLQSASPQHKSLFAAGVAPSSSSSVEQTQADVERLKKVLEREYVSFFSPMETEYYTSDVTFKDPLNDLAGVDAYENNVNM